MSNQPSNMRQASDGTMVPVIPPLPVQPTPASSNPVVAICGECGREVRMIDDDPANGENAVPAEVAPAIEPGRKIMGGSEGKGHALVLLSGGTVRKAIALPNSKEAILEAAK